MSHKKYFSLKFKNIKFILKSIFSKNKKVSFKTIFPKITKIINLNKKCFFEIMKKYIFLKFLIFELILKVSFQKIHLNNFYNF